MNKEMSHSRRNFGLDLMRAMAISGVLLGHFFKFLGPLAYFGVEFFFVLSGFLIGAILLKVIEKENQVSFSSILNFLKRRWFRTVPNYFLFLVINLICFKFFIKADISFIPLKFFVFLQNLAWPRDPFFGESWSLCVEEWFYLCLPLSFWFIKRIFKRTSSLKIFFTLCLAFIIIPLLLRCFFNPYGYDSRMIVVYRLDSIMYGVLLSFIKKHHESIWLKLDKIKPFSLLGCLIIMVIQYVFYKDLGVAQVYLDSVTPLFFALSIPFFFSLKTPTSSSLERAVTNTSIWSYSLYLVHLPLLLSSKTYIMPYLDHPIQILIYRFSLIALSFVLSALIYKHYELPLTQKRSNFSRAE